MTRFRMLLCLIAIIFLCGIALADDIPVKAADSVKQIQPVVKVKEVTEAVPNAEVSLLGTWVYVPNKYILDGEITFYEDGKYIKSELDKDSVRAGLEGHYIFDKSAEPYKLDLCLGECGAPGSEWITTFGIVRFLKDDSLEIRFSPNNEYPVEFNAKPDYETFFMARKPLEKKEENK